MDGGLKSMELDVSVPRRDLLGVSGLSIDWSPPPPPNIMFGNEAGVLQRGPNALRAPCGKEKMTWHRRKGGMGSYLVLVWTGVLFVPIVHLPLAPPFLRVACVPAVLQRLWRGEIHSALRASLLTVTTNHDQ